MGFALRIIDRDDGESLTEREVSEILDIPLGTLRSRRARHLGLKFERLVGAGKRNGQIRYPRDAVQALLDAPASQEEKR